MLIVFNTQFIEIYHIDMNISGSHAMHLQMAAATPWYNVQWYNVQWYNVPLVQSQCTMVHSWYYHWGRCVKIFG